MVGEPNAAEGDIGDSLVRGSRLLALRVCQYVVLFVVGLVVARALGPSGRAQYALPLALATSVWVVVNLSLDGSTGALLARREGSLRDIARFLSAATLILGVLG